MPSRPRLLFVNRSFWPDAEATGQLLTELCEDLSKHFDVHVIAGQPNHNPQGKSFRSSGWDQYQGIKVRRVWHTRFSKSGLIGRALNYLSFVFSAGIAALLAPRPAVVIVETDPPLLCFVGAMVQAVRGCRLVVYLQDIYPDLAVALGKLPNSLATRWLRRAIFAIYRRADRVVVLSSDMKSLLIDSGIPAARIASIPNWVDTRTLQPIKHNNPFRLRHDLAGKFVVVYSGNLGLCQQLETVIEAARHLVDRDDIVFLLIGDGASKAPLMKVATEQRLTNVRFLPYQPKEELSQSISAADIHLVPIDPRVTSFLMPCKLYGILASGTPVLAIAPTGCELADVVTEQDVGVVCPPGDASQLAATIQRLAAEPRQLVTWGLKARQVAESQYDRRLSTQKFGAMLESVLVRSVTPVTAFRQHSPADDSILQPAEPLAP